VRCRERSAEAVRPAIARLALSIRIAGVFPPSAGAPEWTSCESRPRSSGRSRVRPTPPAHAVPAPLPGMVRSFLPRDAVGLRRSAPPSCRRAGRSRRGRCISSWLLHKPPKASLEPISGWGRKPRRSSLGRSALCSAWALPAPPTAGTASAAQVFVDGFVQQPPSGSGSVGSRFDFGRLNNALARGAEPVKSNETAA